MNYSGTKFRNCFGFSLLHAECCDWLKKSVAASNSANWIRIRADTKTLSAVGMCFPSLTSATYFFINVLAFVVLLSRYCLHSFAPIDCNFFFAHLPIRLYEKRSFNTLWREHRGLSRMG